MSKRDPKILLEDMLECIGKIRSYCGGMDFQGFLGNSMAREAVYRNFEVLGEAAVRIPESFRTSHPEIEWKKIIATRNVIIHVYDGIDDSIIWNIIENFLPELQRNLEAIII